MTTLLPTRPIEPELDFWWIVSVGFVSEEDIKNCSEEEHTLVDYLIDKGPTMAGKLDLQVIKPLYQKQLIYLDVPIFSEDCIQGKIDQLTNF